MTNVPLDSRTMAINLIFSCQGIHKRKRGVVACTTPAGEYQALIAPDEYARLIRAIASGDVDQYNECVLQARRCVV